MIRRMAPAAPTTAPTATIHARTPGPRRPRRSWARGARSRVAGAVLGLLVLVARPPVVHAQQGDEDTDGRMEGYPQQVWLEKGSAGSTYLITVILAIVAVSVLFKNARRGHLD